MRSSVNTSLQKIAKATRNLLPSPIREKTVPFQYCWKLFTSQSETHATQEIVDIEESPTRKSCSGEKKRGNSKGLGGRERSTLQRLAKDHKENRVRGVENE